MRTLYDYEVFQALTRTLMLGRVSLSPESEDLTTLLGRHPRLVVALNHGPMLGPLAGLVAMSDLFCRHGGADRRPFGITWRQFYRIPVARQIFSYLTQVDHAIDFNEALQLLRSGEATDCVIMPEGQNCNFGDNRHIQPFLSPRFLELAIRAQVPVLIGVHHGSQAWERVVTVNDRVLAALGWLPDSMRHRLQESRQLSLPALPRPLDEVRMTFRLYRPRLTERKLSHDKAVRSRQLWQEALEVRSLMEDMLQALARPEASRMTEQEARA
ncbi:hypothetical protein AAIA72_10065 [Hahella sp. SMD15-11]|uniref:Phospholipid/glycerol acyltransferase domain-containing protein n=1 Tax=Thermohahella caldifontis TaxID=3142973 RepID=A0AB39UT48_9GAMM